jgi:hypothetical protein
MPSFAEHGPLGPPPALGDDDCKSLDTIKAVLQDHALMNGYAISVDCSAAVNLHRLVPKVANTATPRIRTSQRRNARRIPVR